MLNQAYVVLHVDFVQLGLSSQYGVSTFEDCEGGYWKHISRGYLESTRPCPVASCCRLFISVGVYLQHINGGRSGNIPCTSPQEEMLKEHGPRRARDA